eukprot:UN07169
MDLIFCKVKSAQKTCYFDLVASLFGVQHLNPFGCDSERGDTICQDNTCIYANPLQYTVDNQRCIDCPLRPFLCNFIPRFC